MIFWKFIFCSIMGQSGLTYGYCSVEVIKWNQPVPVVAPSAQVPSAGAPTVEDYDIRPPCTDGWEGFSRKKPR